MRILKKDLIYIAGFFDADGFVGFYSYKKRGKTYYQLQTGITQVKNGMMPWIQEVIGFGGLTTREQSKNNPKWQTRQDLRFYGPKAIKFLELIIPYLRLKKERAIKFINQYTNRHNLMDKVKVFETLNEGSIPSDGTI